MTNVNFLKLGLVVVLGTVVISLSTKAIAVTLITNTKHNLSSTSSYTIKAVANGDPRASQICIFCHTPHNAENAQASDWAPLWNRVATSATFAIASTDHVRPSLGNVGQPDGTSRKCLSCHDGTVAIGSILNAAAGNDEIVVSGASGSVGGYPNNALGSGDAGYVGTNLSGGHIISFVYNQTLVNTLNSAHGAGSYKTLTTVNMLDRNKKMQCHTCHDPHNDWCDDSSNKIGKDPFWRIDCSSSDNSILCKKCHLSSFKIYTFPY